MIPRLVASIAIRPEVVLRPLMPGTLTRVVAIVSRRDGFRSPASTRMQELLHQAAAALMDARVAAHRAASRRAGSCNSLDVDAGRRRAVTER